MTDIITDRDDAVAATPAAREDTEIEKLRQQLAVCISRVALAEGALSAAESAAIAAVLS